MSSVHGASSFPSELPPKNEPQPSAAPPLTLMEVATVVSGAKSYATVKIPAPTQSDIESSKKTDEATRKMIKIAVGNESVIKSTETLKGMTAALIHPTAIPATVASGNSPMKQTANAVNDLTKQHPIKNPLVPDPEYGERVLTEREFAARTAPGYQLTCEQVKTIIAEDVEKFADKLDFNPLHFIRGFLKHYQAEQKKNGNVTPADAFKSYKPNSANQALVEHGATCVGRSIDIVKSLANKHQLKAHVVVETEGSGAPPTHAATIIPCRDGIVLIDIMYAEKICIIPYSKQKPEEVTLKMSMDDRAHYSFEVVQMPSNLNTKEIILHKREVLMDRKTNQATTVQKQILLRTLASVDEPVMKKFMLGQESFVVFNNGPHMLMVNIKDKKIRCHVGRGKNAIRAELPFDAFNPATKTFDVSKLIAKTDDKDISTMDDKKKIFLTNEFFAQMMTNKQTMLDEIFLIISHSDVLKNLYQTK